MKKFTTLLALPIIALIILSGCGKVDRTPEETKVLMNTVVDSYNITENNADDKEKKVIGNWLFERVSDINTRNMLVKYTEAKRDEKDLGLNSLINTTIASEKFQDGRLVRLKDNYQVELNLIFAYYNYYETAFFNNISAKEYNKDELNSLYGKIVNYKNQLASFVRARENFERNVALFGCEDNILIANVEAFYYDYNLLIEKSLDLVKYFRELHYKYFYKDVDVVDADYAIRLYYDGLLTLADYVYKDIFNSLAKNATVQLNVIKNLITNESGQMVNNSYNIFTFGSFSKLFASDKKLQSINSTLITNLGYMNSEKEEDKKAYDLAADKVKQLEISLNNFKEYFALYNKCYNKINFESYNNARFNMDNKNVKFSVYKESLKQLDQANIVVIQDIEIFKVDAFLKSLNTFI